MRITLRFDNLDEHDDYVRRRRDPAPVSMPEQALGFLYAGERIRAVKTLRLARSISLAEAMAQVNAWYIAHPDVWHRHNPGQPLPVR